jgi:Protein of unknown function (DUF2637)
VTDKLLSIMTTIAVLLVALIAAVVSFIHIESLAVTHHQPMAAALLLPLSIDGVVAAMSVTLLRAAKAPDVKAPWLAQGMLFLAIIATLAANYGYGSQFGFVSAIISCWPAVAFIGCVEVAVSMVRRTSVRSKATTASVKQNVNQVATASSNGHTPVLEIKRAKPKVRKGRKPVITGDLAIAIAEWKHCSVRTVHRHPEWVAEYRESLKAVPA